MKCPIDNADLSMTDRQGIEIDYCPQCRGVWLDRGELDKIIERGAASAPAAPAPVQESAPRHSEYDRPREQSRPRDEYYDNNNHHGDHKKRKKEGFLGDLFDF